MAINDPADPEIARIMARVDEHRRLYNMKGDELDRNAVEHLYKKDEDFTGYDVAPPVGGMIGWTDYAKKWGEIMGKYQEVYFHIGDDLRVFRRGDVGWSSASYVIGGKSAAGAEFRKEIRMTMVWVRDGDEWLLTHEHASAPRLSELASGETV